MDSESHRKIVDLLGSQLISVLSTSSNNEPYSCLIGFEFTRDLRYVLFATMRARLKYEKMKANPFVSLTVDTRSNSPDDFQKAISVTLTGRADDVQEPERTNLANQLAMRHPVLTDFVNSPDCAIMRVAIDRIYLVEDFESTSIFRVGGFSPG